MFNWVLVIDKRVILKICEEVLYIIIDGCGLFLL